MPIALSASTLTPPRETRWMGPLLLALLAHGLLVAALTWGISWKNDSMPVVAQAELWSRLPQSAAARAVDEAPPPATPPEPAPTAVPPPPEPPAAATAGVQEPEQAQAQAQADAQAKAQADIALQKQREKAKEQALHQQQALEAKRQAQQAAEAKEAQARREQLAADKARQDKARQDKSAKEAAAKEAAAKEKAAKDKLAKEKTAKEAAAQAQARAAAERADKQHQAQLAKDRAENLKRISGMAGATGEAGSTGHAKQASGPSATYAGRIVAAVRPNIVFTENPASNPTAEVEVRTLPDGTVAARRIVKSSGMASWDDAVLKALDRTARLPRDDDGRVPGTLSIVFRLRE